MKLYIHLKTVLLCLFLLQLSTSYADAVPKGIWHKTGGEKTVVLIGGAEGGEAWGYFPQQIAALKAQGYNVFQSEYFRYPDSFLENIDLNYFSEVIQWLTEQQTQSEILVIAHSRGTEAATWLAAEHEVIKKLVLIAPASHFFQGVQPSLEATFSHPTSAWRIGDNSIAFVPYKVTEALKQQTIEYAMKGQLCPCSKSVYLHSIAAALPGSELPVNSIKADVLLMAAADDPVWPALPMAKNLAGRMQSAGIKATLSIQSGGHSLHQDADAWQKVVDFLAP